MEEMRKLQKNRESEEKGGTAINGQVERGKRQNIQYKTNKNYSQKMQNEVDCKVIDGKKRTEENHMKRTTQSNR